MLNKLLRFITNFLKEPSEPSGLMVAEKFTFTSITDKKTQLTQTLQVVSYGQDSLQEEALEELFNCFKDILIFRIKNLINEARLYTVLAHEGNLPFGIKKEIINCYKKSSETTVREFRDEFIPEQNLYRINLVIPYNESLDVSDTDGAKLSMSIQAVMLIVKIIKTSGCSVAKLYSSKDSMYIKNFVKKYGITYDNEKLQMLSELLRKKGYYFGNEDLLALIYKEENEQNYLIFKQVVSTSNPKRFEDYLNVWIDILSKEIDLFEKRYYDSGIFKSYMFTELVKVAKQIATKKIFLERILKEKGSKVNLEKYSKFDDFWTLIASVRKKRKLEKLEKDLLKDKAYSIEEIDLMSGCDFESFLKTLFEKMGYTVEHTKYSGDQGADLLLSKLGENAVVQAKRSNTKIGNNAIQEVVASINHYKAQKGIVITNNYFTNSAAELAESNKIILLDRAKLIELIEEHL